MNLREQIINSTIDLFNEKGYKFRLDDIAEQLFISKKTIYAQFSDKETLFMEVIRYCGGEASKMQLEIIKNKKESYAEKLRGLLAVWPEHYRRLNRMQMISLRVQNPKIARKVKEYYDEEWEVVEDILKEATFRGEIIHIPGHLLRSMLEATLEKYVVEGAHPDGEAIYDDSIRKDIVRILMNGIEIM